MQPQTQHADSTGARASEASETERPGSAPGAGEGLGNQEPPPHPGRCSSVSRLLSTSQKETPTQEMSAWHRGRGGTLGRDQESNHTAWAQLWGCHQKPAAWCAQGSKIKDAPTLTPQNQVSAQPPSGMQAGRAVECGGTFPPFPPSPGFRAVPPPHHR